MSDDWERAWKRDRIAKLRADPAYRERERERDRERWRERTGAVPRPRLDPAERRARQRERARQRQRRRTAEARAARDVLPFVGCDGEGVKDGTQASYALFRMGARELYFGGHRLTTPDLLRFIVAHPRRDDILVGFAFDYDCSSILRDIPTSAAPGQKSRLEWLLQDNAPDRRDHSNWTWLTFDGFPEFGVEYRPRNYLKVCLANRIDRPDGSSFRMAAPGSTRTIYDVFGFFQKSFLKAVESFGIGTPAQLTQVEEMKAARADFSAITPEVRDYCRTECDMLAALMTKFRSYTLAAGIRPRTWNGAGKLAAAMLKDHGAMRRAEVEALIPAGVLRMAHAAYYGGRFEVTRIGRIGEPVTVHDLNSAYPSAMLSLPCLTHGRFRAASADEINAARFSGQLYLCACRFEHMALEQFLCGLPFRDRDGSLNWPRFGNGVYWSVEIESAERLGATVTRRAGYLFEPGCDCKNWEWIGGVYATRLSLGKKNPAGDPYKLGLNSLYGKQAQRIGNPTYANPIAAGLITAITRARLNDAILFANDPRRVVMIATDALFVTGGPIKGLPIGEALGAWGSERHRSLFIVQPGLYWPPRPRLGTWKVKSRGLSAKFFKTHARAFERAWAAYVRDPDYWRHAPPSVAVTFDLFIGLRHAVKIKRLDLACQWLAETRDFRFGWANKRQRAAPSEDGRAMVLGPLGGSPGRVSLAYVPQLGQGAEASAEQFEFDRLVLEAQPDHEAL